GHPPAASPDGERGRAQSARAERAPACGREARRMKARRWKLARPSRVGVAWLAALSVVGALEVWLHLQTTEVGYQLSALHALVHRLSGETSDLEVELATLKAPGSL